MTQDIEAADSPDKDARLWGMFCHLTAFSGYVIPFGSVFGPLIIWLIKKDEMPFVDDQGKESLNFQLTMLIAVIISAILMFVVIGFLLLGVLIIFQIIVVIIASIKIGFIFFFRIHFLMAFIHVKTDNR